MKKLIIVESPSKAKTIAKYLGNEVTVVASKGHICDLPTRTLGIDIKQDFKPQYIVSEDKKKLIASIKNTMSKCDELYLMKLVRKLYRMQYLNQEKLIRILLMHSKQDEF